MNPEQRVRSLLEAVARQFPAAGMAMRSALASFDAEPFEPSYMLEAFARETTAAVREGDLKLARAHLQFVSEAVDPNDQYMFELIDVFYVEPLFVGLPAPVRSSARAMLPLNLQLMYSRAHGKPSA